MTFYIVDSSAAQEARNECSAEEFESYLQYQLNQLEKRKENYPKGSDLIIEHEKAVNSMLEALSTKEKSVVIVEKQLQIQLDQIKNLMNENNLEEGGKIILKGKQLLDEHNKYFNMYLKKTEENRESFIKDFQKFNMQFFEFQRRTSQYLQTTNPIVRSPLGKGEQSKIQDKNRRLPTSSRNDELPPVEEVPKNKT